MIRENLYSRKFPAIRYYNIRISWNRTGGEELVRVVTGLTEMRCNFSPLGLGTGMYIIQVGSLFFIRSINV